MLRPTVLGTGRAKYSNPAEPPPALYADSGSTLSTLLLKKNKFLPIREIDAELIEVPFNFSEGML